MRAVRVLLLWPGGDGAAAGNFGVPQLVILGSYAQHKTNARVVIRDLEAERILGPISLESLFAGDDGKGYDIIGLSVYSSFDHLKCTAMAEIARRLWPETMIIAGGYHPSACPLDYVRAESPFDVCVVGEGERPLVTMIESLEGGEPLRDVVLGPQPIQCLDDLPPSDWSLLERYRSIAPQVASQAQLYLSRGCPFACAFCMERAKREVSWRSLSVERALEEVERLHRFIGLRGWTLYFGDALFGMKQDWRRAFLLGLAERNIPVDKYWLLMRVDLLEKEDIRLFADANCGLGFGLESGDPGLLATIRKTGRLEGYLERMLCIAEDARKHDVPWGANIICGHPGETPASLHKSAAYLSKLFLNPQGTTGFLSVDPFRLYPGSPIDAQRSHYEQHFGSRFYRPRWWEDGDPEFLSEWIDPSSELDYLQREELQHRLLSPILADVERHFVYNGPAQDYFRRAIREQVGFSSSSARLHFLDRYYAWQSYLGHSACADRERRNHAALHDVARERRCLAIPQIARDSGLQIDHPILKAIGRIPREQFVGLDSIEASTRDEAIALDDLGLASVSAMHAYASAYRLLEVDRDDRVLDMGAGTGYGAAILKELVGPQGDVLAMEVDPILVQQARRNLRSVGVSCLELDALAPKTWTFPSEMFRKVAAGFALDGLPSAWLDAFRPGTTIVAPVCHEGRVRLTRAIHQGDRFDEERFDEVSYVPARRPPPARSVANDVDRLTILS